MTAIVPKEESDKVFEVLKAKDRENKVCCTTSRISCFSEIL